MQSNQIYDADKNRCCSYNQAQFAPSMSTLPTNNGANVLPILNYPKYDPNTDDVNMTPASQSDKASGSKCELKILEQPTEKFRFRYKSEMHGTHGSLNGERSERNKKTFPEVELRNFKRAAVIRCSLYQANVDQPLLHSHQLVVHKDDMDEYDPHDVFVSPEEGYIARFANMGIIHTAKKDIAKELQHKKRTRLKFELECDQLTPQQEKVIQNEAKREAKVMNLNQVRLCFEAFEIVNTRWIRICEPVFSRPISNRKSALTGELKICRLSMFAGSAAGGDSLFLLVEKVNKNNIKVRFFEIVDEKEVWEAYGSFTEADVHHQFAIVVTTPAYINRDIDNHVDIFIELVRDSDNDRSAPVNFRYKPRDIVLARKRRRICSPQTLFNSDELPEYLTNTLPPTPGRELSNTEQINSNDPQFINFQRQVSNDSDDLRKNTEQEIINHFLESDGEISNLRRNRNTANKHTINTGKDKSKYHSTVKLLMFEFKNYSKLSVEKVAQKIQSIFEDYVADNDNGDTIVHEIIKQGNRTDAIVVLNILSKLNLTKLLSQPNNQRQTPLHVACLYDRDIFIRPLLGLKCDPNVQDSDGNTALHIAVGENLKQCTESFLSHLFSSNLNVNLTNDIGLTPLHIAIRNNNADFVRILLVKCNASAKIANCSDGNNALHLAVQQQNKDIVKIILENGNVKVDTTNGAGHTPLGLAALGGTASTEILQLLQSYLPSSTNTSSPVSKFIKEEPESEDSSSSSGDEDDKSSQISIDVKEEIHDMYNQHLQGEKNCNGNGALLNSNNT